MSSPSGPGVEAPPPPSIDGTLLRTIVSFTGRVSKGRRTVVPREAFVRNLRAEFPGVDYPMLLAGLTVLNENGVIVLLWHGPTDFVVTLTPRGLEMASSLTETPASPGGASAEPLVPGATEPPASN